MFKANGDEKMRDENKFEIAKRSQSKDARRHDLEIFEQGHTPSNKKSWEVHKCNARLRVADFDGSLDTNPDAWTEITLEEYETYESGKSVTRSISMYLHGDMRQALIDMLKREPQPVGDYNGNPGRFANLISVAEESAK